MSKERAIYDKYWDEMLWQNGIKNMENEIAENRNTATHSDFMGKRKKS